MAKDCPKCGVISSDEAQRCDCGYNYATGMLRRETNEVDRGFGRIEGGQTYKFGWFVAWSGFSSAVNPQLIKDLGDVLVTWGPILGVAFEGSNLAMGVAAATARPSWPRLVGPEIVNPVARPGLGELSPLRRSLFVAATVAGVLIQQL